MVPFVKICFKAFTLSFSFIFLKCIKCEVNFNFDLQVPPYRI